MKEKLLNRASFLFITSINSIIVVVIYTIRYKNKFEDSLTPIESYIEIFTNPLYEGWAKVVYISVAFFLFLFILSIRTYKKYKQHEEN